MKRFAAVLLCSALAFSSAIDAKGGSSSGGGHSSGGGGNSSSGGGSKGGFSSSSMSTPRPMGPSAGARTTTTTSTTTRRTSGGNNYNSPYVGGGMMYGGFGMGYGYTNGLLTGLILMNMMHPHGTTVYNNNNGGGSQYSNNALLYPDGSVVNQKGYLVGNYVDGVFTKVENGPLVAKPVPADANGTPQQVAQPIIIQNPGPSISEIVIAILLIFGIIVLFFAIIF